MSVDSPTSGSDEPSGAAGCSLCGHRLGDDDRFVTCYPADGQSAPSATAADDVLSLCGDCAAEVDELVDAWTAHDAPPVGDDWSIHAGYERVTDDCSFCERSLDGGPALGVEYFRRDAAYGDRTAARDNYSLCDDCTPVFDEFLGNVGGDTGA